MLTRRPKYKLSNPNTAGDRSPVSDAVPRPSSPLERNPLSPKGWKEKDSDGVGLSIVAKLDRAASLGGDGVLRQKFLVCSCMAPIAMGSWHAAEMGCSGKPLEVNGKEFPVADFLQYCYLCRGRLHGKDVYMYRGEKAFCSEECRNQQIASDEYLEKWGSKVLRKVELSSSPCSGGGAGDQGVRMFFDGIAAA